MLNSLLRDPVPYHGALGFVAAITIEHLNAVVSLLVGVATLVYLCLRIRREVGRQRGYGHSERSGPEDE